MIALVLALSLGQFGQKFTEKGISLHAPVAELPTADGSTRAVVLTTLLVDRCEVVLPDGGFAVVANEPGIYLTSDTAEVQAQQNDVLAQQLALLEQRSTIPTWATVVMSVVGSLATGLATYFAARKK